MGCGSWVLEVAGGGWAVESVAEEQLLALQAIQCDDCSDMMEKSNPGQVVDGEMGDGRQSELAH